MTDYLKKHLNQKLILSDEKLESILICFKEIQTKKNQILIHQNKVCKHLFFIKKGCLRVVCTRDDGQEWTRQIETENNFITIFPSFIEQTNTSSYLQAIEASEIFYISFSDFKKLNKMLPEWKKFYTDILEKAYINSVKRIEKLITMSGKHLYQDFKINHPELLIRLPNKVLASYLGMSQETLSRLKAKKIEAS
ncbi:Crp/Fnr family transcriptional regulator [Maribacter stanieri]|uniref:cAMP-binding domain of CRP or a regulatory subunit of cAMP-dependent protein kinases n=1 Tax=Maribacter stanieri TaxID=440514 RepID=A0A1I6K2W6_9FLAO|nr:Crp/Fnr family transcriptional regulator [Maribacter stanieri]SFR85428.1 cAMP-binding domain of CRP or a regulatory subunit of cAMP-dependent protein kinases [Maribacter stanieri]